MTHEAMTRNGFGQQANGSAQGRSALDRSAAAGRGGSIVLVLLVAGFLVAGAAGIVFLGRERAEPYILIFLAILGHDRCIRPVRVRQRHPAAVVVTSRQSTHQGRARRRFDGIVVTDGDGRVIYGNAAYLDLIGAADARDARPVERVFIGDPDASEAIYRLLKAAREGRRLQEEVRIASAHGRPARWLRMRIRPLGSSGPHPRSHGMVA